MLVLVSKQRVLRINGRSELCTGSNILVQLRKKENKWCEYAHAYTSVISSFYVGTSLASSVCNFGHAAIRWRLYFRGGMSCIAGR